MHGKILLFGTIMASLLLEATVLYASTWEYKSIEDPMTDESIYEAVIASDNKVDVSFNKKATLSMITRFHPRNGWGIEFTVDNGQISCLQGCYATIRFDDEKAQSHVIEEVFNVKDSVYRLRNNPEKVASGLFNARKILIELQIFEHGAQLFRFETNPFDYGRFPAKPGEKEKLINSERERFNKLFIELIKNNWIKPSNLTAEAYANVSFNLDLSGQVSSVLVLAKRTENISRDIEFKRSIEEAIMKSSPLPVSEYDEVRRALYRFRFKFPE